MLKRKNVKKQGKLELSKYFQEFKSGERVAIVREHSLNPAFPKRMQGKTGMVIGMRGNSYLIKIRDGNMIKMHIIKPANLKRII